MLGKFITLEGIDGAGKSTQAVRLSRYLKQQSIPVLTTREPGGTTFGEKLRDLILSQEKILAETQVLLMFAARIEHINTVILPALEKEMIVICDRFTDATFAYQGGGSGISFKKISKIENWVHPKLKPDLTFYFDVSIKTLRSRTEKTGRPDQFEKKQDSYFERVKIAYEKKMIENPNRFFRINAELDPDKIEKSVIDEVNRLISK